MRLTARTATLATAWIAMTLTLTGCATAPPLKPEEAVRQRAQARYDALIAKNYKAAYGFLSPTYRDRLSYEAYMASRPIIAYYIAAKIDVVNCDQPEMCTVRSEVTVRPAPGARNALPKWDSSEYRFERWVKVDDQWWLRPDR